MDILYRPLALEEITPALSAGFERRQEVTRCWRKENGAWLLKDIAFVDDWSPQDYDTLLEHLRHTLQTGGALIGAFQVERLAGFASVENEFFGSQKQYLLLSSLHVSLPSRHQGIGRKLLGLAAEAARKLGAQKLYISAHSAEETQAFYHALGCVEALEYNAALVEAEPCDCQMELVL